jgi:Leucine-rich repeat (LRR) protein
LGNNPITDIAPLTNLGKLEELLLFNTQVADISPLQGLNQRALARHVQHACG